MTRETWKGRGTGKLVIVKAKTKHKVRFCYVETPDKLLTSSKRMFELSYEKVTEKG